MTTDKHTRLVILGSGFGAITLLKRIDLDHYRVTVVSPRNHFLFTPLLPSTTVGTVEFRSIVESTRKVRDGDSYIQASCTSINVQKHAITCRRAEGGDEFTLPYDKLVIAVGAQNNTFGIPGVRKHAFFLKELNDARAIRERVIACLEGADVPGISKEERERLLHFVVVGGGPTGVEFAAELHDLLEEDLDKSYPGLRKQVKITLVEAAKNILNSFDAGLREYTVRHFRRQDIEVRLESPVAAVEENCLRLKSGEEIPTGLIVWSTGNSATGLVKDLDFEKDKSERILTDDHLRIAAHPEIYALGDCATITGMNLPQTAQLAMQQGKYLAKALNREARGKMAEPFAFNNLGMLAYVGDSKALADIPKVRVKWHGIITYFFWRSAYLTRLVSWKNKLMVLLNWIMTGIFGRDLTKF